MKWFYFEVAWTKYEKGREVIQEIWKNHSELQSSNGLVEGLKEYQASLARWSQYNIGYIMENSRQERVYKPWPKQIGMGVMRKK